MDSGSPRLRDLVTIGYQPRQTMRRILDGAHNRWTAEMIVLAFLCTAVSDADFRSINIVLPGLQLVPTLALVAAYLLLAALLWVGVVYLLAFAATYAGRLLDGRAPVADVRAAAAWGMAPLIWSVAYRLPVAFYRSRFRIAPGAHWQFALDYVREGGCSVMVLLFTLQVLFLVWILFVCSSTLAEAFGFETWKGLATIGIIAAAPVVIGVAAMVAFRG